MKVAAVSELKAQLARYLRLVKRGEEVEIQERGVPVAILSALRKGPKILTTPPRRDPALLSKKRFSVKPKENFDIVSELMEERDRR